ncbi:hypothetical protein LJR220_000813 [Bradyrhizobium sp. LjRoot220]|uniref:hypothetical protein n=1 Tax=Bradyrhizobium sp. LjRoot220 TaxID=3342284 RepID=UPI003ED0F0E5
MQPDLVANRVESEGASRASITGDGKEARCFALCSFPNVRQKDELRVFRLTDFAPGETIVCELSSDLLKLLATNQSRIDYLNGGAIDIAPRCTAAILNLSDVEPTRSTPSPTYSRFET